MALNDAILNIGANAMAAAMAYGSIHTATPNGSGSNESSAPREAIDWATASGGDLALDAPIAFEGGAASGAAHDIGFWSASTGGVFYGYLPLTGDTTFNAAGEYTVTAVSLAGSAS